MRLDLRITSLSNAAADVKSLSPMVERLKTRFPVGEVCIVADPE